jgi:hypothetical protein
MSHRSIESSYRQVKLVLIETGLGGMKQFSKWRCKADLAMGILTAGLTDHDPPILGRGAKKA